MASSDLRLILRLDEVRAADVAIAGGKGAKLGQLAAAGFPVPPGFIITAQCYRAFYHTGIPDPVVAEIMRAHAELLARCGDVSVAVRSSATAEDLEDASFAGQHSTYYYVRAPQLLDMVRHCWDSLWSAEAISYRQNNGIADANVAMAVVVQQMIPSEISGVAFTMNPVNRDRGELIIESSWGMGAAIVDGRVTPDRYVVARNGLRLRERRIAEKRFMVPSQLAPAAGERLQAVPHELQRRETLSAQQISTIAEWSLRCEVHFRAAQDVEWAIAGGEVYLLQSRPITTMKGSPFDDVDGKYVLFKPIIENFSEPISPLMADLLVRPIEPWLRVIGGRLYISISAGQAVNPFKMTDEELASLSYSMFALRPDRLRLSLRKFPLAIVAGILGWLTQSVSMMRTSNLPDDSMDEFRELCRRCAEDDTITPPTALAELGVRPTMFKPIGHMPILVNLLSFRFASWLGLLQACLLRWAPQLPAETATRLCSGTTGVKSAEMGRHIERLAEIQQRAGADSAAFSTALAEFLAIHGHRAFKEFDLVTPRWHEDPAPLLGMIRNITLAASARDNTEHALRVRAEAEAAVDAALAQSALERVFGWRRRMVHFAADRARYYFKQRENSRFYHIMIIDVLRQKILRIEADLLRRDKLRCAEDIFFLRWHEIEALRAGQLSRIDAEKLIHDRRLEQVRFAKLSPPRMVGLHEKRAGTASENGVEENRRMLTGQPASPGHYIGVARVILDPSSDATLLPGEVLVAPYTDPAWTPLFLVAGAAVVEVGSYLSHAGTVAREYGMPCIVDVSDCTHIIQTGMRVEVDAVNGRVHILDTAGHV